MFTVHYRVSNSAQKTSPPTNLVFMLLGTSAIVLAWQLACWAGSPVAPISPGAVGRVENSLSIPAGTVLPVRLEREISVKEAQRGQEIAGKIMQDVPLPGNDKIPMKSTVRGAILSVEKDDDGSGVKVTLQFDQFEIRKETLKISSYLRAIASFRAVRSAQIPRTGADGGTPAGWGDTMQIGGDVRYGDGGPVVNHAKQKIGKGVNGGVLIHLSANPASGCDGPVSGDNPLQALWVFSADACGVYDLQGVKLVHVGKGAPAGEITLHFEKDDMKLEAGTGMLLRVAPQS
ncbi:MAG: hypothetical protein WAK48_30860 [Candidatus Acidiferrum sp.]|jgi:hypothetical protein